MRQTHDWSRGVTDATPNRCETRLSPSIPVPHQAWTRQSDVTREKSMSEDRSIIEVGCAILINTRRIQHRLQGWALRMFSTPRPNPNPRRHSPTLLLLYLDHIAQSLLSCPSRISSTALPTRRRVSKVFSRQGKGNEKPEEKVRLETLARLRKFSDIPFGAVAWIS